MSDIPLVDGQTVAAFCLDVSRIEGEARPEYDHVELLDLSRFQFDAILHDALDGTPLQRNILAVEAGEVIGIDDDALAPRCYKSISREQ